MKEIWVDIIGYEGFYQVSNTGKIRGVDRYIEAASGKKKFVKGKVKTKSKQSKGDYFQTILCKNGSYERVMVHRIVAKHFLPNTQNKPFINHIDGNKLNNCVTNLEWCTQRENNIHALETGLRIMPRNDKNKSTKYSSQVVTAIRRLNELGVLNQREIAWVFNMDFRYVNGIIKKKSRYYIE